MELFVLVNGGNGLQTAISFVKALSYRNIAYNKVTFGIMETDRKSGDLNQFKTEVASYMELHRTGKDILAFTRIEVIGANLADGIKAGSIGEVTGSQDPNREILLTEYTVDEQQHDLRDGIYGAANKGAMLACTYEEALQNSEFFKALKTALSSGETVHLISAGGDHGGTGPSFTTTQIKLINKLLQTGSERFVYNTCTNLRTAAVYIGPHIGHPTPTAAQNALFGQHRNVESAEADYRSWVNGIGLMETEHLLPSGKENDPHILDRLYLIASPGALDPATGSYEPQGQSKHPDHLIHLLASQFFWDFSQIDQEKTDPHDSGIRTIRFALNEEEESEYFSFQNLPDAYREEIVSYMRFCYLMVMVIEPLFRQDDEHLKEIITIDKLFRYNGRLHRKSELDSELMRKIRSIFTGYKKNAELMFQYFCNIQSCTKMGHGEGYVQFFDQACLERLTEGLKNDFADNVKEHCNPDELTRNIDNNIHTNLSGSEVLETLCEDRTLINEIRDARKIADKQEAADKAAALLVNRVYKIAGKLN